MFGSAITGGGAPSTTASDDGLTPTQRQIIANRGPSTLAGSGAAAGAPSLIPSPWRYDSYTDPVRGTVSDIACTTSENQVQQTFPYRDAGVELCLRRGRGNNDAWIRLQGNGQIVCRSYSGCRIAVRADEGRTLHFEAAEPADYSSDQVFLVPSSRLVSALRGARRLVIEVPLYQAGQQAVFFPVQGFSWPERAASSGSGSSSGRR